MALSPGMTVAGYTIETVLGAGGMGTVYKARNPALPRSDALKVLSEGLSRDEHFRARFLREADLAATLDHPNIVTVYTRGETPDGQLWIAMQYVDGSDAEKESRAGRMTPQRAAHIIGEVGKALDYAHRRQLLHRDVKPANFLLGTDDDERVFLADFGIARALDDAVNLTQTGMVVATIAYAAPESLSGYTVDGRADVYSLGCSLYNLLTQRSPFGHSGGMAAMMAAHLNDPPPRATDLVPELPATIDHVIARAMAKNPDDRYQSARELAAAAARALDESTVAMRPAPTMPAPQWTDRPRPGAYTYPGAQPSGPHFAGGQPPYPRETNPPAGVNSGGYARGNYPPSGAPGGSVPLFGHDSGPRPGGGPISLQHRPPPSGRGKFSQLLRDNRRVWGISAAAAAAIAIVVVLVVATSGGDSTATESTATSSSVASSTPTTSAPAPRTSTAAPPPAPANVDATALPGLLLTAGAVSEYMRMPGMTALPIEYALLGGSVTPPNCTGAWGPGYPATYDGSGFTGFVIQGVAKNPTHKVAQAIVSFPDANAAKAFYDRQAGDWTACGATRVKWEYQGASNEVDVGVPGKTAGILTLMLDPIDSPTEGQQCERNLAVRANVIVDVRACSPTIGSSGLAITTAIADKIK